MNSVLPETCWAIVLIFFVLFLILDGFDLGVGMLQFFVKPQIRRDELVQKILPFWNGNEVFLLVAGGALFAFFPQAYATICSSLYIPINLLLFSLIARAICIATIQEFPGRLCSFLLALSSFAAATMLGIVLGNLILGIKLNETFQFSGKVLDLFQIRALYFGLCLPCLLITYAWLINKKNFLVMGSALATGAIVFFYRHGIPVSIVASSEESPIRLTVQEAIASNTACTISGEYFVFGLPLALASMIFVHKTLRPPQKK